MQETIHVEGLSQTVSALRQLARKDVNRIVRKGLRRGGAIVRTAEREEAPHDTGKLRKAIGVKGTRRPKGTIAVSAGVQPKKLEARHFYPAMIIYGYRTRGTSGRKVPPNDFAERAFQRSAEAAADAAVSTIEDEITQDF